MAFGFRSGGPPGVTLGAGVLALSLLLVPEALAQPKKDLDPLSFDRSIGGLLSRYCYKCHNEDEASGDIDLKKDENPRLIAKNAVVWQTALDKIESIENGVVNVMNTPIPVAESYRNQLIRKIKLL